MNQQLATHNEQMELRRDLEEAFDRMLQGKATDDDAALLAWAAGIANYHKRKGQHGKDR